MSIQPSSMSMLGVPYSPIVPSLTIWQSGAEALTARITLNVVVRLLCSVERGGLARYHRIRCGRLLGIMHQSLRLKVLEQLLNKGASHRSPICTVMSRPDFSFQCAARSGRSGTS